MSVIVTPNTDQIIVCPENKQVIVTAPKKTITVSSKGVAGAKGDDGEGVPAGGSAGQVLAKVDGTDYNTEWVDDANTVAWIDVAGDVEYTGVETQIASGDVLTADYKGGTIYRLSLIHI